MAEKLKNKKRRKIMKTLKSSKGFTLIEIIAVLVILGILAAVAVPKYINLQEDAKNAATKAALGAAASNVNLLYAKKLLNGTAGTDVSALVTSLEVTAYKNLGGDYTATYSGDGKDVIITISAANAGVQLGTPKTKTVSILP
jgi:prepilin-type N-terminal cleavage/methylation domain-containing protein